MKVERINEYIALHRETPITELRDISPAIWDHTVLFATRHRWTCLNPS